MVRGESGAGAEALIRALLSLGDPAMRTQYLVSVAKTWSLDRLAAALDVLCQRAEQAESTSREALVAVVDALNTEALREVVQRLREQAVGDSRLSLERLIRHPGRGLTSEGARSSRSSGRPGAATLPAANPRGGEKGTALTLGERKSLARRPDRETMQKLLADPHPDVIRRCLGHPRVTEDDVIPLAARRLARAEVLAEIARSRWLHRPRVRLALALNPSTPLEIAARIVGLLLRPELELVARSPQVSPGVRALCLDHLARRPPTRTPTRATQVH
jgi:hypothetical protein